MSAFFDLMMCVIAVVLVVMGMRRGVIGEVFRLVAMVGGFIIAFLYFRDLQAAIKGTMGNQQAVAAFAFIVIFIASFLAITGIGFVLRKFVKFAMLGWLDGILGGAIGLMKAALIAWVACLSISSMPFQKVQTEFGRSVVYKAYCAMPRGLTLPGLEDAKNSIRGSKKSDDAKGKKVKPGKDDKQKRGDAAAAGTDV